MSTTAVVQGRFLDVEGRPAAHTWVQFVPRVDLAPLANKSALVIYDMVSVKTDADGYLPPTRILGSDVTGVNVPWSLVMRIGGQRRERFRFLAPAGTVQDMAEVIPLPDGEVQAERWASYAQRAEIAAQRAEEAVVDIEHTPSFVLIFENGLV